MVAQQLEYKIGRKLSEHGLRLAVAESCTGGLISHRITNVPGSSNYFEGGICAYSYDAKVKLLGVSRSALEKYGAVSDEIVRQMARGVRKVLNADIGLSVSGIAGPGGGTDTKPVGLVYFGLSAPNLELTRNKIWKGTRQQIKKQSAEDALLLLMEFLSNYSPNIYIRGE